MPSAPPTSTRPSRASARAERVALALACLLAVPLGPPAAADAEPGRRVSRGTSYDEDAWARADAAPAPPRPEPEAPPPRERTTAPAPEDRRELSDAQTSSVGHGVEVALDPRAPHAGRVEYFAQFWLAAVHHGRRFLYPGFGFFPHTGIAWSEQTDSRNGHARWVGSWLVGAEPSFFVMGNRGGYVRAGVDVRLEFRRHPPRMDYAPRFAVGYMGRRRAFELGTSNEPFMSDRLHDGSEAWDGTTRSWFVFLRVNLVHPEF